MRFSITAVLAFAATAIAQVAQDPDFDSIYAPDKFEKVPAGSTYEIKWNLGSKKAGTVSITILGGDSPDLLVPKDPIATGIDNTLMKYSWKVDAGLGKDKTYGILITLDSDEKVGAYSPPFYITGYGHTASGSASGSASASASSGSSNSGTSGSSSGSSSASDSSASSASKTTAHSTKSKASSGSASATAAPSSSAASSTLEVATSASSPAASGASATTSASKSAATGAAATAGSFAAVGGIVAALLAL